MAELDEPGDEPNLTCLGPLDLTFVSDDQLLLTETDLTEQKETTEQTEQTETEQLNDAWRRWQFNSWKPKQNRSQLQNNNFFVVE